MPFDTTANAEAMLDALAPSAIVFAKLDVWPTLVDRATRRGIPCVLVSATLSPRSGRLGTISRAVLGDAYAALEKVGAIDESHARRLELLGARRDRIVVTGDTRFDQVAQRARETSRDTPLLSALESTRPTVVAGSTWPADEAVLLNAWQQMLRRFVARTTESHNARPRLIIAPHEPTPAHLAPIEQWASRASLDIARLGEANSDTDVVLVDRVGVLGQLYALADIAFVGGGFHAAGLHSVIEPAAFGVPVLFGPRFDMSREAELLLAANAARSVTGIEDCSAALEDWIGNGEHRLEAGANARAVVDREQGAVGRSLDLLIGVLKGASRVQDAMANDVLS
jgi:3-deoxy-D-manno-octulosonic-acid transferase